MAFVCYSLPSTYCSSYYYPFPGPCSLFTYGPVHNFWLFSFERFNGILGDFKTNQRAIETQLMRKFLREQDFKDLQFPNLFREQLEPLFHQMSNTSVHPFQDISSVVALLSLSEGAVTKSDLWLESWACT